MALHHHGDGTNTNTVHNQHDKHGNHYGKLALMALLSFVSMYVFMYAMVDRFANVFPNVNQFYMAGLMTMPMLIIEVLLMRMMYNRKSWNAAIIGFSAVALIGFFLLIRQQTAVGDKQFIKSMIPHHSGAILMCSEADITDPELKKLCEEINVAQEKEINQMKTILERLEKN